MRPWTARGTTLQPDSAVELYLEQRYNVQLEPWYGIDSYDSEGRDVRLAAGDVPDYLGGFASGWVDIGIVRELPREMIREHMPGYMVGRTNTSATRCGVDSGRTLPVIPANVTTESGQPYQRFRGKCESAGKVTPGRHSKRPPSPVGRLRCTTGRVLSQAWRPPGAVTRPLFIAAEQPSEEAVRAPSSTTRDSD